MNEEKGSEEMEAVNTGSLSNEEREEQAEALKAQGNDDLKNGHLAAAIRHYSEAIDIYPTAIYYSNRAMAYIKAESFGLALADANTAIALDPTFCFFFSSSGAGKRLRNVLFCNLAHPPLHAFASSIGTSKLGTGEALQISLC